MGRIAAAATLVAALVGTRSGGAQAAPSADEELADLSLEELLEVDVSPASYVLDTVDEPPVSMTTITREDIAASGARTLAEVLGIYVPGFFLVEDQDDVIAAFRGLAPDNNAKVLFLLDGRSVNTEWFGGPPDALLNGLDLAWIERIEVVRGPGSVTLGQGALLGVINVITARPLDRPYAHVSTTLGASHLAGGRVAGGFADGDVRATFYLSRTDFAGQRLRDQGWARAQENPTGVSVYDRGHHLKAADQELALAQLTVGELTVQALQVEQTRDNYNFYRDREVLAQRLLALTASWHHRLDPRLELDLRVGYDHDELGQRSLDGQSMAGTREDRVGGVGVVTASRLAGDDRLALGVEVEHVEMGLPDRAHQNLIVNEADDRATATNRSHTWVERDRSSGGALLAEYAYRTPRVTAHAGLRLDLHRFWGTAWSPRAGAIVRVHDALTLRANAQTGFRGAVGVHYAGGFRRDGLLAERNFDAIDDNPALAALGFRDLPATQPERMTSLELGARYRCAPRGLTVDAVGFVARMTRVIDVGVIFVGDQLDAAPAEQRRIGTDEVGDWGGWFFFKNNPGAITSGGLEVDARWRHAWLTLRASVALVAILDLERGADQIGSMYISGTVDDPHFRAYPEQVGRLGARATPCARCWIDASAVGFGRWYSPAGTGSADGDPGAWLDLAAGYRLPRGFSVTATVKNLTGTSTLWPMNSNAGDPSVSAGTPALEARTAWLTLAYDR